MIPGTRFIGWASRFVPLMRRRQWQREWEAEVAYAWGKMNSDGPPSWLSVQRLRIRIWTCLIDALWEMTETMTMTGLLTDF
jgi:hypothetical protein